MERYPRGSETMGYVVVRVLSSVSPSLFLLARRHVCRAVLYSLLDSLFMGSRVMFAVIQDSRLLGTGETPLEAWISAYEALGRPLGPEDVPAFCLACTERLARQVRLYRYYVANATRNQLRPNCYSPNSKRVVT